MFIFLNLSRIKMKDIPKDLCGKKSTKSDNKDKDGYILFNWFCGHGDPSIAYFNRNMKFRKRLLLLKKKCSRLLNQRGQSLVEFVLLLAVISMLSYGFVAVMNRNIGAYWEHCVNLVVTDNDPDKPRLKVE